MRRVVITGMGALTPIGIGVPQFWDSVMACRSGADKIRSFDTTDFTVHFACEVTDYNPDDYFDRREARRIDPFSQYALVVAEEAIKDSGIVLDNDAIKRRVGCVFGTGIGGIHEIEASCEAYAKKGARRISPFLVPKMMVNAACGQIAIRHGIQGANFSASSACASAAHAIMIAYILIRSDEATAILAGGSEAAITPLGVGGFCSAKALSTRNDDPATASRPFCKDRDGFVMGEGAGALFLEEYEHAVKRGARIYAEVVGIGMTDDAHHITAPLPDGAQAKTCMENALQSAGIAPEAVNYINAHGTSTKFNDLSETNGIKSVFKDHAYQLAVSSTKSQTGHLLGASSAIEAVACVKAIDTQVAPPTINYLTPDPECDLDYVPNEPRPMAINYALSNSFGFGGHNATIIFGKV